MKWGETFLPISWGETSMKQGEKYSLFKGVWETPLNSEL